MQTSLLWLQRRHLCRSLSSNPASYTKRAPRTHCRHGFITYNEKSSLSHCRYTHIPSIRSGEDGYTSEPVPFAKSSSHSRISKKREALNTSFRARNVRHVPADSIGDPEAWAALLDVYLPNDLRKFSSKDKHNQCCEKSREEICQDIVAILESARREQHAGVEILTYMITNNRRNAALYIVAMLLDDIASRFPLRTSKLLPSNIQWPGRGMHDLCRRPINLSITSLRSPQLKQDWNDNTGDPRYSFITSEKKEAAMTEIWSMLGTLVVAAANLPTTQASEINNAVLLVLGQIHKSDLVPESIYFYRQSSFTTTIQRPPILHLVSSRILTAISDAAWRQQQDEMIEKAASYGIPYETIGRDPPGGRFRLKVRPLGPEIWLEFILWCCVEGGFTSAGTRIVRNLKAQTDNPWFAVTWSPTGGRGQTSPAIDWQRLRDRNGGSVGLREGYSDERPFVEMPARTISTEVVLGLADASINAINSARIRPHGIQAVQKSLSEMISFLEPHDLPASYFDFLAVRLMQTGVFDQPEHSYTLQTWYKRLTAMRLLPTAQPRKAPEPVLRLDAISSYSELFAGILHQALDGCIQSGDIHRSLDIFNLLQELVDASKLQAIGSFLDETAAKETPALLASGLPPGDNLKEFVRSHGQLPTYKITGLLDLATNTGLTGFGQWLLYNDGPDGPMIPPSAYQDPGLAQALLRFATVSQDTSLLKSILAPRKDKKRKFTVNFVRAIVNAHLVFLQFDQAYLHLETLSKAQGGGLGLTNIAQLAAVIFRLETADSRDTGRVHRAEYLKRGQRLLEDMLAGSFNNKTGAFQTIVRRRFRHQVGALLQILQFFPHSLLSTIGAQFAGKYPIAYTARLDPTIFNYLLESVVQVEGSLEGMRLWNLCCNTASLSSEHLSNQFSSVDDDKQFVAESWDGTAVDDQAIESDYDVDKNVIANNDVVSTNSYTESLKQDIPSTTTFSNNFFPPTSTTSGATPSETRPLVNPSQQTLRLVIRAAVRERQEILQSNSNGNIEVQKQVLAWASEELRKFGATPRMISIEIEEPLKQAKIRKLDQQKYTLEPDPSASGVSVSVRRVHSSTSA